MSTQFSGTLIRDLDAMVDSHAKFDQAVDKLRNGYSNKEHFVLYHLIGYFRSNEVFRQAFTERVEEVCK